MDAACGATMTDRAVHHGRFVTDSSCAHRSACMAACMCCPARLAELVDAGTCEVPGREAVRVRFPRRVPDESAQARRRQAEARRLTKNGEFYILDVLRRFPQRRARAVRPALRSAFTRCLLVLWGECAIQSRALHSTQMTHPLPSARQSGPARLALEPAKAAKAASLRYVTDAQPGLARVGSARAFRYTHPNGKRVADPAALARIKALAIPPAWMSVWICANALGHIQATGRDARGRKQYRYHAKWRKTR